MKALLLAAGRGARMRPLTDQCPKPLLTIGSETLIERHLRRLGQAGVREVVVNLHYLGEMIRNVLGDGRRYGLRIEYSVEDAVLETGGGARRALRFMGEAPFMIVSSDVLVDYDFGLLTSGRGIQNHLVLVSNPAHHPSGDFNLTPEGLLRCGSDATFSGIGVISPALLRTVDQEAYPLRDVLFPAAVDGMLTGEMHSGYWSDVGTPERLSAARADFEAGLCR